ncbi:transglutaminase TgpA family protein [Frondihabitans australicus]|uniref:Transglutaminase-like putative cysteine protease n=1 Tax=Frondihabitans australicus TaxID=386892 RepID=A0A495IES6_9MICO|nr:DUF3488 and transglutaminase-like domain-containing protein [Frondihabitans australicus]RKR73655.1 transglutaminase-like putative cysteine protease [Frondihabitans australicus]
MVDLRTRRQAPAPSQPRPARQPARPRWGLTAALWFTLVVSLASIGGLFQGTGWWFASATVALVVLGAQELARTLRWPAPAALATGLVVAAIACTLTVSGGTALLGVIPTADTIDRVRLLAQQASETIVADQAPVPVSAAILAVIVGCVAVASIVIDVLARILRTPVLTGAVFAVVLVVPSLVPDVQPSWPWVVLTVLGFIVVLLVSTGRRPSRSTVITGVASLAAAGIVTSLVPMSVDTALQGLGTGAGISTGVNPVVNLGKDLRRGTAVNVLSYTTTDPNGEYLKLVDLVDFSGKSWSPAKVSLKSSDTVSKLPAAPGISSTTRRKTATTKVSVSLLRSPYLPIPVPATKITGVDSQWKYVDASGVTVRSSTEGSQGLDYTVVSKPVNPTRAQIVASLGQTPASLAEYRSVKGVPASISTLAKKVTAGAANPFDAAVDLQNYFRNGDFTYSETTPVREGYDGTGLDAISVFLKRKSGYCVHFASAMAVMARTLGIPSRMAVGFLPGTQNGDDESWTVTSNDLHTWPELYFQGLGWVPFEPTPGQGTTSDYLQQTGSTASPSASATASPSDSSSASASSSATAQATATSTGAVPSSAAAAATTGTPVGTTPLLAAGIGILLLLALSPWWLRTQRRRRRLRAGPPDAALNAWREVVDTARDLGIAVPAAATPVQAADVLRVSLARDGTEPGAPELESLLAALQRERFGDEPAAHEVHDQARRVIARLRRSVGAPALVRATVAPRTLFAEQRSRQAI